MVPSRHLRGLFPSPASLALIAGTALALAVPFGARAVAAPAGASASPYATQVTELRAVRTLLQQADHDYKGHRAAAVKLITAAIHALQPPHANAPRAKANAPHAADGTKHAAARTGGNEPQAVSDAQLKQAMGQLAQIQTQLSGAAGTAPAAASAALQKAVQELQTALSVK